MMSLLEFFLFSFFFLSFFTHKHNSGYLGVIIIIPYFTVPLLGLAIGEALSEEEKNSQQVEKRKRQKEERMEAQTDAILSDTTPERKEKPKFVSFFPFLKFLSHVHFLQEAGNSWGDSVCEFQIWFFFIVCSTLESLELFKNRTKKNQQMKGFLKKSSFYLKYKKNQTKKNEFLFLLSLRANSIHNLNSKQPSLSFSHFFHFFQRRNRKLTNILVIQTQTTSNLHQFELKTVHGEVGGGVSGFVLGRRNDKNEK